MINSVQVDTNSNCGSKCFFCPSKYYKRPHVSLMSNDMFESILVQLSVGIIEDYVDSGYSIWLSSYNDILQDPLLEDRLKLLRKYRRQFQVLTNGIGLLKNVDLLSEYKDVIHGYSVNLPAGNSSDYNKYTTNDASFFDQIIKGLISLYSKDPVRYKQIVVIVVNGVYDDPIGRIQMKVDIPIGDTEKQVNQLILKLPYRISDARPLCDRAGLLRKINIIDNQAESVREMWKLRVGSLKASGCNGGDRLHGWLHISSKGDLYTCCQDFLEVMKYGNLSKNSIKELIDSKERQEMIEKTLEKLCVNCWFSY